MRKPYFLVLDADEKNRRELAALLKASGASSDQPDNPSAVRHLFQNQNYDCVLVDQDIPSEWRIEIENAYKNNKSEPLIFVTGDRKSSLLKNSSIQFTHGYIPRESESTRLLIEHVKQAVARISKATVRWSTEKKESESRIPQQRLESFADSRIIIETRHLFEPCPLEDLVSVSRKDNGQYLIFLGDCTSPKSIGEYTGLLVRSQLDNLINECSHPAIVLEEINHKLVNSGSTVDYMTAVCVLVDLEKKRMNYSVAGHFPPLYRRWRGLSWRPLKTQGIPLGIRQNEKYFEYVHPLNSGDKVLLLSDGFFKTSGRFREMNSALSEIDLLPSDAAPNEIIDGIYDIVEGCLKGMPPDEITATLIQV